MIRKYFVHIDDAQQYFWPSLCTFASTPITHIFQIIIVLYHYLYVECLYNSLNRIWFIISYMLSPKLGEIKNWIESRALPFCSKRPAIYLTASLRCHRRADVNTDQCDVFAMGRLLIEIYCKQSLIVSENKQRRKLIILPPCLNYDSGSKYPTFTRPAN